MRPIFLTLFVGAAIWLAAAPVAAKDLKLKQSSRVDDPNQPAAPTYEEVQYWTEDLRISDIAGVRRIVDLKAQTITTIQKDKKTYFTMSFDDMRKRTAAIGDRLKNIPPELRAQLGLDTPMPLKPTGTKEKIAGLEATKYEAGERGFVWIAEDFQVPEGTRTFQDLIGPFGGMSAPTSPLAIALKDKKGLPVKAEIRIDIGPHRNSTITEVDEIVEESPPAEFKKIPEGFTKVDAPSVPGAAPAAPAVQKF